jgi:enediyne biosynthesis protein E5
MTTPSPRYAPSHLAGLRRFAVAITVFNLLGHTVFGFEQSYAQPLVALAAAYGMELLLDFVESRLAGRPMRCAGGVRACVDSLLSAHISGLAVAMLLYTNARLGPTMFAAAAAIASKTVFRAPMERGTLHFFNPSNFGISLTLLLFPWVGIAPPYHFTENLNGVGRWILPAFIIVSGSVLNGKFTHRLPLVAAWLVAFATQAIARSLWNGTPVTAALLPMTGVAFILFTFYMVTDPATTPGSVPAQMLFGAAVAAAYCALISSHIVFGLFFGLSIVSMARGAALYAMGTRRVRAAAPARRPALAGVPAFAPGEAAR